jgi:hypothetical protein
MPSNVPPIWSFFITQILLPDYEVSCEVFSSLLFLLFSYVQIFYFYIRCFGLTF